MNLLKYINNSIAVALTIILIGCTASLVVINRSDNVKVSETTGTSVDSINVDTGKRKIKQ